MRWRFILCGTFRNCAALPRAALATTLCGVTPAFARACVAVPWRYQARCPTPWGALERETAGRFVTDFCEPTTKVSGLSSRSDCSGPAITRLTRQLHYIILFPLLFIGSWKGAEGCLPGIRSSWNPKRASQQHLCNLQIQNWRPQAMRNQQLRNTGGPIPGANPSRPAF
jgi:hypothetical protein